MVSHLPPVPSDGPTDGFHADGPAPSRRRFLQMLGLGAGVTTVAAGCELMLPLPGEPDTVTLDFSTDIGVLNYAYALEQLEAAFYAQAVATPYAGITDEEIRVLRDLRDHEIIHREFFETAIPALGGDRIQTLELDFSAIDFSSRESVLQTARAFEDLGVSAYNGAGRYLMSDQLLTIAGKIVSVEARHAAAIRDLLQPLSTFFAADGDVVDEATGLGLANPPPTVLDVASTYIVTPITVVGL